MRRTRTELKSWGALLIGGGLLLGLTLDAKSARADDGAARVVAREHRRVTDRRGLWNGGGRWRRSTRRLIADGAGCPLAIGR